MYHDKEIIEAAQKVIDEFEEIIDEPVNNQMAYVEGRKYFASDIYRQLDTKNYVLELVIFIMEREKGETL